MSGDDHITPPPTVWAQRSDTILLTVCLEDCTKPEFKIYNDKLYFKGAGGSLKKIHEVTINLYKSIDPEKSSHNIGGRVVQFILKKKEESVFWPRLTKEKVKFHWLKVDFPNWGDSDSEEENENCRPAVDVGFIRNGITNVPYLITVYQHTVKELTDKPACLTKRPKKGAFSAIFLEEMIHGLGLEDEGNKPNLNNLELNDGGDSDGADSDDADLPDLE